jgi:hypothetical protein
LYGAPTVDFQQLFDLDIVDSEDVPLIPLLHLAKSTPKRSRCGLSHIEGRWLYNEVSNGLGVMRLFHGASMMLNGTADLAIPDKVHIWSLEAVRVPGTGTRCMCGRPRTTSCRFAIACQSDEKTGNLVPQPCMARPPRWSKSD